MEISGRAEDCQNPRAAAGAGAGNGRERAAGG